MWKLKTFDDDKGRCVWFYDQKDNSGSSEAQKKLFQQYDKSPYRNSADKIYRDLILSQHTKQLRPHQNSGKFNGEKKEKEEEKIQSKFEDNDEINKTKNVENTVQEEDNESKESKISIASKSLETSLRGIRFYKKLQNSQGFWPGDYGGPMFLLPNLVICFYITGTVLDEEYKKQMLRYIKNHQNNDGGWGTHIQSESSTMFGSVMNYVAARILGLSKTSKVAGKAQKFIKENGGAVTAPPWGKLMLSVLGVHEWDGLHSLMPDLWMLSEHIPIHPSRWWCHCRMVYLPMAYIYAKKIQFHPNPLTKTIRKEIYCQDYETIDWVKSRSLNSSLDQYNSQSNNFVLKTTFKLADIYENYHSDSVREKSTEFILKYIRAEDSQTDFIDIGPINKVLNAICMWHTDGPDSKTFKKHVERMYDYLWLAEDGLKMQGYNGSQLWDTAFALNAISFTKNGTNEFDECLRKSYKYLDDTQTLHDVNDRKEFFRHSSKGGWPFSTRAHGWPISDCTSHGLTAVLIAHENGVISPGEKISDTRLKDAADLILSFQNCDGGFPTYENQRGSSLLESLNNTEIFDRIMVDYSYVELTGSAIKALCKFKQHFPEYRREQIELSVERSVRYIKEQMRSDGSWYGSWGVCFTYAAFFAIPALIISGETRESQYIQKACAFLVSKQKEDGGWGESFQSSTKKKYVQNKNSQVVNTSWALIALIESDYENVDVIGRGVEFLRRKQLPDGDWPQEDISGVFNANCMITYTAYRNVFPIWALSLFAKRYKKMY